MKEIPDRHFFITFIMLAVLLPSWTVFAQDPAPKDNSAPPVPPPPPDGPSDVPPPPPDAGAPPAKYKSDKTATWGTTKTAPTEQTAPTVLVSPAEEARKKKEAEQKKKEAAELKKKCDDLKKAGKELTDDCKAADLEIVFQGAVRRPTKPLKSVVQARDVESDKLHEKSITYTKDPYLQDDGGISVWEIARREPQLLPESRAGFFSVGANAGYPMMFARGSTVKGIYKPVIDFAAEARYQMFRMLQLAVVADFHMLKGGSVATKEITPSTLYPDQDPASTVPLRHSRDVGAIVENYVGFGLRPTVRFDVEYRGFELFTGVGFGWHLFHTSGKWRTKLPEDDRANIFDIDMQARWLGDDEAFYTFKATDSGVYSVFELALLRRWLDGKLGAGILMKYTLPLHGTVEPDVTVKGSYGVEAPTYNSEWKGYTTEENDYGDTFIRNLSTMSFLSFGLIADWRF